MCPLETHADLGDVAGRRGGRGTEFTTWCLTPHEVEGRDPLCPFGPKVAAVATGVARAARRGAMARTGTGGAKRFVPTTRIASPTVMLRVSCLGVQASR